MLCVVCVESSRIRENSDAFHGDGPNSYESGYEETSHFTPRNNLSRRNSRSIDYASIAAAVQTNSRRAVTLPSMEHLPFK